MGKVYSGRFPAHIEERLLELARETRLTPWQVICCLIDTARTGKVTMKLAVPVAINRDFNAAVWERHQGVDSVDSDSSGHTVYTVDEDSQAAPEWD